MKAWIATQDGRLCVEQLPSYAPELNPVEGVWSSLKARELANLCAHSLYAVRCEARRGLRRAGRQKAMPLNLLRRAGLFFRLCCHCIMQKSIVTKINRIDVTAPV